jgi:hypothetical protein
LWERLRSEHEFTEFEGLGKVVVGTELKAGGFVVETVGGGKHKNWHTATGGDNAFGNLVAGGTGNIAVKNRYIVGVDAQEFQSSITITGNIGGDCRQA